MHIRTTAVSILAVLALTLTACSSEDSSDQANANPSSPTTAKAYTYEDCVDLLEYDFQDGQPQDASDDPECSHLTSDRYQDAVAEVLTAHKDEILEDAGNEAIWDTAWDELDADAQTSVCDLLLTEGPETGATQGVSEEQAQYYLDSKC
ncbi:hypothetical protein [Streptomyces albogriseolus]|uniref:hypothetical protein n=1 Tax=Streptomyces albogriseolus TaxID=1887 RepID=UPI00367C30FB